MKETTEIIRKKAVIYCRVSTKEQADEGNSLVSQERLCREYAIKEGYEIAEVYIEKGESAKTAKRKELQRLLDFCTLKKGNIHAVISYKVDRISRNIADYSLIRVRLKKYGVEIKSVTEYFEDTPAGRFMENIIANVGQFDNDVRTERSMGGMREATMEGRYVWMAPLGYSNVKVNGKSTIAQNNVAPLIREVFERISLRVDSTDSIRIKMADKGLQNRKGAAVTRSNFFWLLRNPLYKGIIKKFGKQYEGTFDPIVSVELFDEVQSILNGKKNKVKHYLHDNPDFPLRRFVVNENGQQLTGYWSQGKRLKYPYYSFHLPKTTIRKEILEEKFLAFLDRYTFDDRHLKVLRKYLTKHFEKHYNAQKDENDAIEKRVSEINQNIDNLIKLENKGSISTAIFEGRVSKLDAELNDLKQLSKQREEREINVRQLLLFASKALKNPYLLWLKSSLETRKRLQVFDFPDGVVFDGVNFRTPKVCSIFKLKEQIDDAKFSRVLSGHAGKNTVPGTNFSDFGISLFETRAYWQVIAEDLRRLQIVLSEKGD